jgi:hypothetical protein
MIVSSEEAVNPCELIDPCDQELRLPHLFPLMTEGYRALRREAIRSA